MSLSKTYEVQTTLKNYLRELPSAIGHMDYEVTGERVIARDGDHRLTINLDYEGERHIGALDLPMTAVTLDLDGYSQGEADRFMQHFEQHMMRTGGG